MAAVRRMEVVMGKDSGGVGADMNSLAGPRRVRAEKVGTSVVREGEGLRQARKKLKVLQGEEARGNLTRTQLPTLEQARRGEFVVEKGERFDTARKGETVLVNGASRARGAATMYARKQISKRELMAAEKLCGLFELSQSSQLSGVAMSERVEGGMVDLSGARLRAAAAAFTIEEMKADDVLRFFHYSHLPERLQAASKPFCDLERIIIDTTPRCPQRTIALNKLIEAKDAAVRALVPPPA